MVAPKKEQNILRTKYVVHHLSDLIANPDIYFSEPSYLRMPEHLPSSVQIEAHQALPYQMLLPIAHNT